MFKKLFNLLFRRKPKHPAIVRKLPNGVIVAAHTEEEADRYEAAALKLNLRPGQKTAFGELEALRLNRMEQALRSPMPSRIPPGYRPVRQGETAEQASRRSFTTSPDDMLNPLNPASPNYAGRISTFNHDSVSQCETRHSHSHSHNDGGSYDSGSSDSSSSSSSCD